MKIIDAISQVTITAILLITITALSFGASKLFSFLIKYMKKRGLKHIFFSLLIMIILTLPFIIVVFSILEIWFGIFPGLSMVLLKVLIFCGLFGAIVFLSVMLLGVVYLYIDDLKKAIKKRSIWRVSLYITISVDLLILVVILILCGLCGLLLELFGITLIPIDWNSLIVLIAILIVLAFILPSVIPSEED